MEILFLTRTAGTYVSAGLPNITGVFVDGTNTWYPNMRKNLDGAFYAKGTTSEQCTGGNSGTSSYINGFDASRSSSIYGNSTTVQPASLTSRYYIKY